MQGNSPTSMSLAEYCLWLGGKPRCYPEVGKLRHSWDILQLQFQIVQMRNNLCLCGRILNRTSGCSLLRNIELCSQFNTPNPPKISCREIYTWEKGALYSGILRELNIGESEGRWLFSRDTTWTYCAWYTMSLSQRNGIWCMKQWLFLNFLNCGCLEILKQFTSIEKIATLTRNRNPFRRWLQILWNCRYCGTH